MSIQACVCGAELATITTVYTTLRATNGGPGITVGRGFRVTLAPGFVNATRRHPSGMSWYVPATRASQLARSPQVRAPFVVTCRCGHETAIERFVGEGARKSKA
jgi:hypothetical protein